jgi:hypothetical protein
MMAKLNFNGGNMTETQGSNATAVPQYPRQMWEHVNLARMRYESSPNLDNINTLNWELNILVSKMAEYTLKRNLSGR